jgi:replicative superfamily II helicase
MKSFPIVLGRTQTPVHVKDPLSVAGKAELLQKYGREIQEKLAAGKKFCIVTGVTGAGKTTLIPWALMKTGFDGHEKVVVTVPKRYLISKLYSCYYQVQRKVFFHKSHYTKFIFLFT